MPTVSVIVPNYNHARYLPKRIGSTLAQTYQDFELILLDDSSTDESRSILSEYANDPRVRIEFNEVNLGTYKQWNKGIRLARGEYIWIAESDDYADERFLERLVPVLAGDSNIAFVHCRSWQVVNEDVRGFVDSNVDPLDPRWQVDFCVDGREECRNYFVPNNAVVNTSAVLFRKAAYEQIGGADETLRICGDWKVWAAMALTGRVAYIGEPLNYYRSHDTTLRSACWGASPSLNILYVLERLRVARWILDQVTPTEAVMKKADTANSYYWFNAVVSPGIPLRSKLQILWLAMRLDPHMSRGIARTALRLLPVLASLYLPIGLWYRLMEYTKPLRYRFGLRRRRRLSAS